MLHTGFAHHIEEMVIVLAALWSEMSDHADLCPLLAFGPSRIVPHNSWISWASQFNAMAILKIRRYDSALTWLD